MIIRYKTVLRHNDDTVFIKEAIKKIFNVNFARLNKFNYCKRGKAASLGIIALTLNHYS